MDFMLALNVTIYGLGIVFLALLVLMVAIMLLTKVFAVVTGRDVLSAVPDPAPSPTVAVPAGMRSPRARPRRSPQQRPRRSTPRSPARSCRSR